MATQKSRARYPARITFQMSQELKDQLLEVARREYGGDLQTLGRECLHARVNGDGSGTDQNAEILQALERLRQDVAGRNQNIEIPLDRLLGAIAELNQGVSLQLTEMMATHDKLEKLADEVAKQNRERRLDTMIGGGLRQPE